MAFHPFCEKCRTWHKGECMPKHINPEDLRWAESMIIDFRTGSGRSSSVYSSTAAMEVEEWAKRSE